MIPEVSAWEKEENRWKTTKTYKIDFEKNRIQGKTDGKDAVAQAVYKILNTTRYEFEIYNWNYGCEVNSLFGKNSREAEELAEKYIEEALTADKRIKGIRDFSAEARRNVLSVYFVAESTEGDIEIESEVKI